MDVVVLQTFPIPGRAIAALDWFVPISTRTRHLVPRGTLGSMARLHVNAPAPDRMYVVFTTPEEPDLIVTLDDSRQVLCHIKRFRRHSISKSIPELREDD